jgi:hypothetical protein
MGVHELCSCKEYVRFGVPDEIVGQCFHVPAPGLGHCLHVNEMGISTEFAFALHECLSTLLITDLQVELEVSTLKRKAERAD